MSTKRAMEAPERPEKKARADVADVADAAPVTPVMMDRATYDRICDTVLALAHNLSDARDCWHKARAAAVAAAKHGDMALQGIETATTAFVELRLAEYDALVVLEKLEEVRAIKRHVDEVHTTLLDMCRDPLNARLVASFVKFVVSIVDDVDNTLAEVTSTWKVVQMFVQSTRDDVQERHEGPPILLLWEKKPDAAADEPAVAADEPAVAADEPAVAADEPAVAADEE